MVDAGVDLFVIRGTTVSAEHVSGRAEPLNLKRFIYELDVPVIVGGASTYTAALHLMRTGAAGVLVGFGGGAAHTTRVSLGIHAPMATAVADVAAARRDYLDESGGRYVHVIADGGVGRSGDLVKAVACGADAVMLGAALARARRGAGPGLALGPRGAPPGAAARRAGRGRHGGHARGDPVRPGPPGRRHAQPRRRAAPGPRDHRLLRPQGVPARRGRRLAVHPALRRHRVRDGAAAGDPGQGAAGRPRRGQGPRRRARRHRPRPCAATSRPWSAAALLRRVHGGAIPVERLGFEPAVADREGRMAGQKERIAKAALAELPDGGAIILDAGTTTIRLAEMLPPTASSPSSRTACRSPCCSPRRPHHAAPAGRHRPRPDARGGGQWAERAMATSTPTSRSSAPTASPSSGA